MKEIKESYILNNLGDELIENIKNKVDFFSTMSIVFPSSKTQQWFKAYWLKTQSDILMNVEFINIDEKLFELISVDKPYKLMSKELFKSLVIKQLAKSYVDNKILPNDIREYLTKQNKLDAIKLYDLADQLTVLFSEYEKDNFKFTGFQKEIYNAVLQEANIQNKTTLADLYHKENKEIKVSSETLYFFGFTSFNKLQESIIEEYAKSSNVVIYLLKEDKNYKKDYSLIAAPSKLREIEVVHSQICELLKDKENNYSDFLVLASDISSYEEVIARVFNQDNKVFPSIPYALNDRKKAETNLSTGLKKLLDIFNKKFYTRLDFFELISNKDIQQARNITESEVVTFSESIVAMNVYRDNDFVDDWDYAKKRVILSKIVDVNESDDNMVDLTDNSYLPFSSIGLNDETLVKFVKIIDDLKSWNELLDSVEYITTSNLIAIKEELSKWFSIKDKNGFETNSYFKSVLSIINTWISLNIQEDDKTIPLNTFFYMLKDSSKVTLFNRADYFVRGITFADFDVNSILSAKYVFFLNTSSKELPIQEIKSELDLREEDTSTVAKQEEAFFIQYQNAINKFFVSYVNFDVKTHEEFYKSSFVLTLLKRLEIDKEKLKTFEKIISLDETRSWNELYTKRAYKNKEYYLGLLSNNNVTNTDTITSDFELLKKVKVKDMADYLEEPLKYKAKTIFGYKDDLEEKMKDEYEPFELDNLKFASLSKKIMTELLLQNKLEATEDELKMWYKTFELQHQLPSVNEIIKNTQFNDVIETAYETVRNIKDRLGPDCKVIQLDDLIMDNWILSCDRQFCRSITDLNRKYAEIKKDSGYKNTEKDYLYLYVIALMDVATLPENEYEIDLVKKSIKSFKLTPSRAKELLENIYAAMNDYSDNHFMFINYINDEKVATLSDISENLSAPNGNPWGYFDDKILFDFETQLGYEGIDFADKYKEIKEKHVALIEFMELKESEVENND